MTIISSGELALQNAGTNPSETVDNKLLDTTMTTGLDSFLQIRQRNEVGDGTYSNVLMWQGDLYGFNQMASNFSSSYIHQRWSMNTALGIQGELRGYSSQSTLGSLGSTTYSDNSSVNRTIRFLLWGLPDAAPSPNNNTRIFGFALAGSSVTNTDNTFEKIKITTNGGTVVTIDRDDLAYDAYENGNSWWEWHGTSGTVYNAITSLGTPSSGTSYDVEIISGTTTTTNNNGIAEEFGGADSSNVALSDYYKGDLHDTTGIPTSGEIKFSDFLGKTYEPVSTITSFTGGGSGGKLQKKGFAVSGELNQAFGSNLSPATQDAFGANVDLRYCYIADNTMNLRIKYDINSGTVNTTSWSTLTISRSGYTNITISRTSLTSNAVASGNYYITTGNNSMSNTQMSMLGGGTVTLTFT